MWLKTAEGARFLNTDNINMIKIIEKDGYELVAVMNGTSDVVMEKCETMEEAVRRLDNIFGAVNRRLRFRVMEMS